MDSPETWRLIWLVAAALFAIGEMSNPGTFFLLPFALGAVVAALLAFAGVGTGWEWLAFVGVSGGVFAAMRPIARRLDNDEPVEGIGARRLIGEQAVVLEEIPNNGAGLVRVHREEWRAQAIDDGVVAVGARVRIVEMRGTQVMVHPVADADPQPPAIEAEPTD